MNTHPLDLALKPVLRRQRFRQLLGNAAIIYLCLAAMAGAALILQRFTTTWLTPNVWSIGLSQLIPLAYIGFRLRDNKWSPIECDQAIKKIETTFPELDGQLVTATQVARESAPNFLQSRLLDAVVRHASSHDWRQAYPLFGLIRNAGLYAAAMTTFVTFLTVQRLHSTPVHSGIRSIASADGIEVAPGDTEIERGQNLVVSARFRGKAPSRAELVWNQPNHPEQSISLTQSLADLLFGGGVPDVSEDFDYRVASPTLKTRSYHVHVFEVPKVQRIDAVLSYPAYTKAPERRVEDIHRASAVEGTRLQLVLQLNHPVKAARLVARSNATPDLVLEITTNRAQAVLSNFALTNTGTYDIRLTDVEGRTNRPSPPLVLEAIPNRPPEIKVIAPKGDIHPSAIEEISFAGTVWDDIGVVAYGLGLSLVGKETRVTELGRDVAGQTKKEFRQGLALEELHLKAGDLVSWYFWADDLDRDGKLRRTTTALYFAEIRPFDEIFREGKSPDSSSGESSSGPQSSPAQKLAELQKQVLVATWNLQSRAASASKASRTNDLATIRDSQQEALKQATATLKKSTSPQAQQRWQAVTKPMQEAIDHLTESSSKPEALSTAVTSEQAAYQQLLSMAAREHEVTRQRQKGSSKGNSSSNQRQIDQLDLAQSENKYENQKQAQAQANPQQQEQAQALDRLKELARRQEDANDRLKELQSALTAAKTEEERNDIKRQLKRLQEDERQLIADADELRQRMERPENQSAMSQERRQLDQTRSEMQRAADAAETGAMDQALAAGTRAQEQLQQQRESMRRQNASQVGEDLKNLRAEARELARQQAELEQRLQAGLANATHSLDPSASNQKVTDDLAKQESKLSQWVERARQVAQSAEASEPRASQKLEDSLRKFSQDDTETVKQFRQSLLRDRKLTRSLDQKLEQVQNDGEAKSVALTTELNRQGLQSDAVTAGNQAQAEINQLSRGVDDAAASAVGDDSEAMRRAARELDKITDALKAELAAASPSASPTAPGQPGNKPGTPSATPEPPSAQEGQGTGSPKSENSQAQAGAPGGGKTGAAGGKSGSPQGQAVPGNNPKGGPGELANGQSPPRSGARPGRPNGGTRSDGNPEGGGNSGGQNPVDTGYAGGGDDRGPRTAADGPITGGNFSPWANRLRDVEEMVDSPDLRNAVAAARERARQMRIDFKNHRQKPDWLKVQTQIVQPLVEVRNRLSEELARRGSQEALVPLDRDPVPTRYAEQVQHYYQELGKDH